MRFIAPPTEDAGGLLKAPALVDVVFILLAFFVMATQVRLPERDFGLGTRGGETGGAVREDFPSAIPVRLRPEGGRVAITIGQARLGDDDYDAIRATLAEINMPALPVLILAHPSLTVDQVARALDAALAGPMKNVSVARLAAEGDA
jgi:biopolymer transport protein ExbD